MEIFTPPLFGYQGLAGKNLLRNGNGAINQRAVSGTVTLAAGAYGHDGFKAGANGCTYTFAISGADTLFTISAGTLVQVIEPANVFATSVWLGWFGTSTARIWQGTAAGTFVAGAPISMRTGTINTLLVTGLSLATATVVEFGTGTLGYVQCEEAIPGIGPTSFERRLISLELMLCQRYFQYFPVVGGAWDSSPTRFDVASNFTVPMRAAPTVTLAANGNGVTDPFNANYAVSGFFSVEATSTSGILALTTASATAYRSGFMHTTLQIALSSEL